MARRHFRSLLLVFLICLFDPSPAWSQVRHFIVGLTPAAGFDVRGDNILVRQNVQASEVGSLTYSAEEAGYFEVVPTGQTDTEAPAAVSDLAVQGSGASFVILTWTATGDDGGAGTASSYDIRFAATPVSEATWNEASHCTGEPTPGAAGHHESFTINGLASGTRYYVALKVADEAANVSAPSNVAMGTTTLPPDTTPPAVVTTLVAGAATATTIELNWTAPGDDGSAGTAAQYELRYSTSAITEGNFANATPVSGEPSPGAAGQAESFTVTGLIPSSVYWFALRTADEVPNWSGLSNTPDRATQVIAPPPPPPPPPVDLTPPAAVTTLEPETATTTTIELGWTAPGDDGSVGTATQYDLRYATFAITAENFASAMQVTGNRHQGW